MAVTSFTKKKLEDLNKEIDDFMKNIERIKKITEKKMWLNDLAEFERAYGKFLRDMSKL